MISQIWLGYSYQETDNRTNKTRQGYARKRTLKPAGFSFLGGDKMKSTFNIQTPTYLEQAAYYLPYFMDRSAFNYLATRGECS